MSLTPAQLERRKSGIGGSDATKIMSGDWLSLYNEKLGITEGENLDDVFQVQLGTLTEELNLEFLRRKLSPENAATLCYYTDGNEPQGLFKGAMLTTGKTFTHPDKAFMLCHPDAMVELNSIATVVDAKHINAFMKPEAVQAKYHWQMVHNCIVMGVDQYMIQAVYGNVHGEPIMCQPDQADIEDLIAAETNFWFHVENKIPPPDRAATTKVVIPIEDRRLVCMTGSNQETEFLELTKLWPDQKIIASEFAATEKLLKDMVPDDATAVYAEGCDIIIDVSKTGSKSIKAMPKNFAKKHGLTE